MEQQIRNQWVIALESQRLQGLALEMIGTKPVMGPVSDWWVERINWNSRHPILQTVSDQVVLWSSAFGQKRALQSTKKGVNPFELTHYIMWRSYRGRTLHITERLVYSWFFIELFLSAKYPQITINHIASAGPAIPFGWVSMGILGPNMFPA